MGIQYTYSINQKRIFLKEKSILIIELLISNYIICRTIPNISETKYQSIKTCSPSRNNFLVPEVHIEAIVRNNDLQQHLSNL